MNDESLGRANAFLAAVAQRTTVGEVLDVTPAEIGRDIELPDALSAARAVRALIARKRLEPAQGSYRLLDASPVAPGEKESIGRRPRRRRAAASGPRSRTAAVGGRSTYSEIGHEVVERLIDLGREVGSLRASLKAAREEAHESRASRIEAERHAEAMTAKVHDLEQRADMAESNLRALLAAAKGSGREVRDQPVGDTEMEAILGVLKGGDNGGSQPSEAESSERSEAEAPADAS
jgi:hypothetical protein